MIWWLLEHLILLWIVVRSRAPIRHEVKSVAELIDHRPGFWAHTGAFVFASDELGINVSRRDDSPFDQVNIHGVICVFSLGWAERRHLNAAIRRWECKRVDEVVVAGLEAS